MISPLARELDGGQGAGLAEDGVALDVIEGRGGAGARVDERANDADEHAGLVAQEAEPAHIAVNHALFTRRVNNA